MADRLHPDDIEAIARRTAELMRGTETVPAVVGLVDVKTLAGELGVSTDFVYSHARELGGRKLTGSPRAPWRFDLAEAVRAHVPHSTGPPLGEHRARRRRRERPRTTPSGVELLVFEGNQG